MSASAERSAVVVLSLLAQAQLRPKEAEAEPCIWIPDEQLGGKMTASVVMLFV